MALSCPLDESLKDGQLVLSMYVLKVRIDIGREELEPLEQITVPLLVVCSHHASGDVVVCMAEQTFPMLLLCRWKRCHETSCGRGNKEVKWVRKS